MLVILGSLVGVVIPSFNQGIFLEKAIKSVVDCFGNECTIVVIDGGSSDNSVEVIKEWEKNIYYWQSQKDNGQAWAINKGAEYLKDVKYICWLNSDDEIIPETFKKLQDTLENDTNAVAAFGKAYMVDKNSNILSAYPTETFDRDRFALDCTICQPATLIRKSDWDKVGGLNEDLYMCLDYDLWWRLSEVGKIAYVEEFVAYSRDHEATKTNTRQALHLEEAIKVLKRHYGKVPYKWFVAEAFYSYKNKGMNKFLLRILIRIKALKNYYFTFNKK